MRDVDRTDGATSETNAACPRGRPINKTEILHMRVQHKIPLMVCGMLAICGLAAVHAETLYRTGFEAANEPFGDFVAGTLSNQNDWNQKGKAEVSTQSTHAGAQSVTPGPGDGKYGAGIEKRFEFPKKPELWVDCMVDCDGFGGFVWVTGTSAASGEKPFPAVYFFITSNGINVKSGQDAPSVVVPKVKMDGWHRLTLRLNFVDKTYDLYVDANLLKEGIPFYTAPDFGQAEAFAGVTLGGASDPESRAYYDDFSIATTFPLP